MIIRDPEFYPPTQNPVTWLGRATVNPCRGAGRAVLLFFATLMTLPHVFEKRARNEIVYQMFTLGVKSLGVLSIVAAFTGMILALQTGIELRRFGQEENIGTAVMMSMVREMGPFMTGLILAASVGSAIAAQMGTMMVQEEVAALEVMSINPARFLVMPRLVAMAVMTPLLSFYSCILGVVGGGVVGYTQLGVAWGAYFDNAFLYVVNRDLFVGMLKAFIFGVLIVVIACHQGFSARNGAVGVGNATRRTVIISFLSILLVGYFVTRLFYY